MKFAPAEPAGQDCHCTSLGESAWPIAMSDFATRISTVAIGGGAAVLTSGGFSERPASMAATPPAARATVSTTMRAAFILFTLYVTGRSDRSPNHMAACATACTGFHQLKVKVWLRRGI